MAPGQQAHGPGSDGKGPFRLFGAGCDTARTWAETAIGQYGRTVSFAFTLEPQLQTGVAPVALGVFRHDGDGFFLTHDDQQLSGPGDGGVEDAATEQVG